MTLHDILCDKGSDVRQIGPEASLDDAVQELVRHNVGSLVVCQAPSGGGEPKMIGIITERDVLRACAAHRGSLANVSVRDVMSAEPITGSPRDAVQAAMGVMTEKRIRHLPIIEEGKLQGMISIGDLVKAQHDQMAVENHYLKNYIQG